MTTTRRPLGTGPRPLDSTREGATRGRTAAELAAATDITTGAEKPLQPERPDGRRHLGEGPRPFS